MAEKTPTNDTKFEAFRHKLDNDRSVILQRNFEQQAKIEKELTRAHDKELEERLKQIKKYNDEILKLKTQAEERGYKVESSKVEELQQKREKAEKSLEKFKQEQSRKQKAQQERVQQAAESFEFARYKALSLQKKHLYTKELVDGLTAKRKALSDEISATHKAIQIESDAKKKAALQEKLKDLNAQELTNKSKLDQAKKTNKLLGLLPQNNKKSLEDTAARVSALQDEKAEATARVKAAEKALAENNNVRKAQEDLDRIRKNGTKQQIKDAEAALQNAKKTSEEYAELEDAKRQENEVTADLYKETMSGASKEVLNDVKKSASQALSKVGSSIDANLDALYGNQGRMMGRLQGSLLDWKEAVSDVSDAIGFSGMVSRKNVVAKMVELVDSGVAYNVEMRAFLAETSENIAHTFKAFDSNLLRMIRIQQQDTTAARLGMEATLTKLFNEYFEDSSYLTSVANTVSGAILDASATMSKENSLQFEYAVQKWLGSLYSLGISDTAVAAIAGGINAMGTGNVTELSNNSALSTLFAMSASRGGLAYSDILLNGLNGAETNKLLRGMIEYLAEIASSQTNFVTKSAYAELFGMSVTDLSTFARLTTQDIESLYNSSVSYNSLMKETSTQLNQVANRISMSKLVDTAVENILVGTAETIGSNAFTYGTWKTLGILEDYVGELKIPGFLTAGFGLSEGIDILKVLKTGMVGLGLLGSVVGGLGSMMSGGPTNLANWNMREATERGKGLTVLRPGTSTNTSYSAVLGVGSASSSDAESTALTDATESAKKTKSEEGEEAGEYPEKIYNALAGDSSPNIISLLQGIDEKLAPDRVFYTAVAAVLSGSAAAAKISTLSATLSAGVAPSQPQSVPATTPVANNSVNTQVGDILSNSTTPEVASMEVVIAAAIRAALQSLDTSTAIPVNVTSMPMTATGGP